MKDKMSLYKNREITNLNKKTKAPLKLSQIAETTSKVSIKTVVKFAKCQKCQYGKDKNILELHLLKNV
jgi:predicted Zn-ribbon and HTH transcriptional regulator